MLSTYLYQPQATFARRAVFQVHLWAGLALGLYACVIGVTGSMLVFERELQALIYPEYFALRETSGRLADPEDVIRNVRARYPGYRVTSVNFPTAQRHSFLAYAIREGDTRTVFAHPESGDVLGELPKDDALQRISDLHVYLLAGRTGLTISGGAAGALGVMSITGLFLWWPGVSRWTRALVIDLRRGWKRVVWQTHTVLGFWLCALLLMWSITGTYIAFPQQFRRAVNTISPLTTRIAPLSDTHARGTVPVPDAPTLVARAQQAVPGASVVRYVTPAGERSAVLVVMARDVAGDSITSDEVWVYLDRYTGAVLEARPSPRNSVGDWLMSWLFPVHAGWFAGPGVKMVWCVLGLTFPVLFITGTVMWWNRKLSLHLTDRRRDPMRLAG